MPNAKIVAPPNTETQRVQRASELRGKGSKRTAAETTELVELLEQRVDELEAQAATGGGGGGGPRSLGRPGRR